MKYDEKEVLRYLGYRGKPADGSTLEIIGNVYDSLCQTVRPKYIFKKFDCTFTDFSVIVDGVEFKSRKLLSHLKNSQSIVLMGATLGAETDMLIRRFTVNNAAYGAVAQSVAASMTENLCDIACDDIERSLGGKITPRFSPGYGDLALSSQSDFFNLLPMTKRLGVTLSDSFLMTPAKSVTAFVGILR